MSVFKSVLLGKLELFVPESLCKKFSMFYNFKTRIKKTISSNFFVIILKIDYSSI